ncbi:hypothetical protein MTO96_052045 [Rhipicephalus appendiculatus]
MRQASCLEALRASLPNTLPPEEEEKKKERAAEERAGRSRVEAARTAEDELLPRRSRRALDRTCLSKFQSRCTCPRSCSGGPSKVRGRGLVSGSCQGAVAEAGLVDEAYRVRSSWVVANPGPRE